MTTSSPEPPEPEPLTLAEAIRDRAVGCLLGLAMGDAVGTTLEFKPRDTRPPLTDMVGGGPFGLKPGQWTDDTAMALALPDNLAAHPDLYHQHPSGYPTLTIKNGTLDIRSTLDTPLGVGFELDTSPFTPLDDWRFDSLDF